MTTERANWPYTVANWGKHRPVPALDWGKRQPVAVQDGVLAVVLSVMAFVPTLSVIGAQIGDLPGRPADALSIVLTLAQTLPLAGRRKVPGVCFAVIGFAFAGHQVLGYATTFGSMGLYVALYSAGAHQARSRGALPAVASAGYVVLAVVLHRLGSPQAAMDYLAFFLVLAGFWLLGRGVRVRRARELERRRLAADAATAAERARIARELHDVVTHHVTAMVIQTDAAQFLIAGAPERATESLVAVSDTGRRALTELRSLLDVLEATGDGALADPARTDRGPTLGRLADLVEQARASGQPVRFSEEGERTPQPVDIELAAYRTVQEALTNAMKHAPGQPTTVSLRHTASTIEITVTTDGPRLAPVHSAEGARPVTGGGRGLTGLGIRIQALHGELHAGPSLLGGFEVRATLPLQSGQE
ncbi:histidine kinase [Streptomyces sp. NPDC001941]|uniref:sensor histidine kinase n=1 Tax=Streptomyces sp. NPDC001941 TaxID=3154659 RepID=UPI00332DAE3D